MNRTIGSITILLFASLVFACEVNHETAHAWDSTNPDHHGWDQPPTNDYSTYGGSSSRQDQQDYLQNQERLRQEEEIRHSYQPPANYGVPSDGSSRSDTLLSTPGQPDKLCTHGYNLTYCF